MVDDRRRERVPGATELLDAWDAGTGQSSVDRAITLLRTSSPDVARHELEHLSVGERDGRLLTLCETTLGARIAGLVNCPACGDAMEISFLASDVRVPAANPPSSSWAEVGSTSVHFRLPNSRDLAAAAMFEDVAAVRRALLRSCVLAIAGRTDAPVVDELEDAVVDAIAARMGEVDPQADVALALECPACSHAWHTAFDVAAFFWMQLDAWAKRTLHDVHTLARAYGWSEHAILSLSATRRQVYLDMVGA